METILVATDFSQPAQNALNYAAKMATQAGAELVLLNVFSPNLTTGGVPMANNLVAESQKQSEEELNTEKKRIETEGFKRKVICVSKIGSPKEMIKEAVEEYKADAIVMGITGDAGMIKEKIIGSTTLDIARELYTPLFIVPANAAFNTIRKISFACDIHNFKGSAALEKVMEISSVFNSELEVVNVEKPKEEDPPIRMRNYNFLQSIMVGYKHEVIILKGEADSQEILKNYFDKNKTDLIILNPKKQSFIEALFHKSMTRALAFHLSTPMLIVH